MPADILFMITLVGLAVFHFAAVKHAWAVWNGRGRSAAGYVLLGLVGWVAVVAVVATSLPWGAL